MHLVCLIGFNIMYIYVSKYCTQSLYSFTFFFFFLLSSVDNSEYMRNGDFLPTRLQAQQDAVNIVCHSKTRSNPENNVGLITMAKWVCKVGIVILICISCQFITYYGDFIPGEKAIMMVIKAFHAAACSWKMTLSGASPVTAMPLVWLRGLIGHWLHFSVALLHCTDENEWITQH